LITERKGKVVKGLGGLYEVRIEENGEITRLSCRAKGVLKRDEAKVLIGDDVTVAVDDLTPDSIVISSVNPRKNALIRPPLANLDYLFIVFAAAKPSPVIETVDKLTAIAEHNGIIPVIIVTKSDVDSGSADEYAEIYRLAGYPTFITSSDKRHGIDELSYYIKNE
jgi:ribosome biogenesis GTPase